MPEHELPFSTNSTLTLSNTPFLSYLILYRSVLKSASQVAEGQVWRVLNAVCDISGSFML